MYSLCTASSVGELQRQALSGTTDNSKLIAKKEAEGEGLMCNFLLLGGKSAIS